MNYFLALLYILMEKYIIVKLKLNIDGTHCKCIMNKHLTYLFNFQTYGMDST